MSPAPMRAAPAQPAFWPVRQVNLIVIHCSATPNGRPVTAAAIDDAHVARGFERSSTWRSRMNPLLAAFGYHFLIRVNGALETGRHLDEIGAHVVGNNRTSVGICMAGTDAFREAQWNSLRRTVEALLSKYPDAAVRGHRDLSPDRNNDGLVQPWEWLKTCPGFDVPAWGRGGFLPHPMNVLPEAS